MFVVLGVHIANMRQFKGLGIRWARLKKETLQETALFWHGRALDRHFTGGNDSRYRLQARKEVYRTRIKQKFGQGQGKWVSLLLRGQSQRWMRVYKVVSGTANSATLRMRPPRYFTAPFIGAFRDGRGRTRVIAQQPNKPDEVTRFDEQDRQSLRWYMQQRLQQRVAGILFAGSGI